MPSLKISALPAATTPLAGTEIVPIVQGGTTDRATVADFLKSAVAGSAAAPSVAFSADPNTGIFSPTADTFAVATGGTERLRVDSAGNVGIGVTPKNAFTSGGMVTVGVKSATLIGRSLTSWLQLAANLYSDAAGTVKYTATGFASAYQQYLGEHVWFTAPSGTVDVGVALTERMRLDVSGNLGLGVTPSAWNSSYRALQVTSGASLASAANSSEAYLSSNAFLTSGAAWQYIATANASQYRQAQGVHSWFTAGSGTAGTTISFTQAMTLDASGNLLVGTTTPVSGVQLTVNGAASIQGYKIINESGFGTFRTPSSMRLATDSNGIDISAASFGIRFLVATNELLFLNSVGNLGLGTSTFGTSAATVLSIANGTEPSTGPADTVQFFSVDRSAGNTIPGIRCEGTGVTDAAITNVTVTNKIAIKVNGTIYYLLATTSAA